MQAKTGASTHRLERLVRIVPPLALALLLILAALLLAARSAFAATHEPLSAVSLALEEESLEEPEEEREEEEEGDQAEEECEVAEEEFEAGELDEATAEAVCEEVTDEGGQWAAAARSTVPNRCPLRSAHARAVALASGRRLKLTVGYTTNEPTGATVQISRGSTRIGSFHRHLGRSGVLRIVKRLGHRPVPRRIVVRFRIAGAPRDCSSHEIRKAWIRKRTR